MRNYTTISLFSLFILSAILLPAQSAEKTLVKSFNLDGNQLVELFLAGDVEVQEWNNPILRIQMSLSLPNGNNAMLKSLIQGGRYNLKGESTAEEYEIKSPNLQKKITVGGQELHEKVSYLVYAPTNVIIKLADSTTANALNSKESF
ncbi:MAG: hypothetical protein AB8G22_08950 [Saprospiraceae bacterium]